MTDSIETSERSRILVIDDDGYFITMVKNGLKDICDVTATTRDMDGLKLASKQPLPDLILLDIMMPGLSGYQICRELKQNPVTYGIPVIFVSGLDKASEKVRCFELGGVDFVTKPAEISVLAARIKSHLMLKLQREMLVGLSANDPLTGLVNQRSYCDILQSEWKRAERHKQSVSLILCDIDAFTAYNDNLGRNEGDNCLQRVGKTIFDTACRAGDTVARTGNDQFSILLPNCDSEGCLNVAQRVKNAVLEQRIPHPDSEISEFVTISIGVAFIIPDEYTSLDSLTKQANNALEAAKENGKNRVGVTL